VQEDEGSVENVWDSLVMIKNSRGLQIILVVFLITVSATCVSCLSVMGVTSISVDGTHTR
jgi:hypothetical protein